MNHFTGSGKISFGQFLKVIMLVVLLAGLLFISASPQVQARTRIISVKNSQTSITNPQQETSISADEAAEIAIAYVAEKYSLSREVISVGTNSVANYEFLEHPFQAVAIKDNSPYGIAYKMLVDLSTGEVTENISEISQANAVAERAHYGKLDPTLYEKIQNSTATDEIPVIVWMVSKTGQSQSNLEQAAVQQLSEEYPDAKRAVELSGRPMDVEDPKLAQQIYERYVQLMQEDNDLDSDSVAALRAKGITVTPVDGMRAFSAALTKTDIQTLEEDDQIGAIFLADTKLQPEMDIAVKAERVTKVWNRGINGSGIKISLTEDGNIDPTDTGLHVIAQRLNTIPVDFHASKVANIASSINGLYKGVAYGADLISASFDPSLPTPADVEADAVGALTYSLNSNAQVVNASWGLQNDGILHFTDKAFDALSRNFGRLVVKSAGNSGNYLSSPGNGWNVFAVANFDDHNTQAWSDDSINSLSSWKNPPSTNNDREKPEIAAVGTNVLTWDHVANAVNTNSGTSFAAPQVTGQAALLIKRNSQLQYLPEAIRAIIMATAFNNIEDTSGSDARDGAGGIDVNKADLTSTRCSAITTPCGNRNWWSFSVSSSGLVTTSRYFNATAGKRVRAAISWWSASSCPNASSCSDFLATDLDLYAYGPGGESTPGEIYTAPDQEEEQDQVINGSSSFSWDNNYELIDFVPTVTGIYRLDVVVGTGMLESGNNVGLAVFSQ